MHIKFFNTREGIAIGPGIEQKLFVLRTTDGGNNWSQVNDSTFGNNIRGDKWNIDLLDINTGYFFISFPNIGALWKTEDGFQTWQKTNLTLNAPNYPNVIDFYDEYFGVAGFDKNIKRTTDGGETWEDITVSNDLTAIYDLEFSPNEPSEVWLTGVNGIYFSSDSGNTWEMVGLENSDEITGRKILFNNQDNGFVLCDDTKLFYNSNVKTVTQASEQTYVKDYKLYQNYPNPFNPVTKISYRLPKEAVNNDITIEIFDVLGNKVETMTDLPNSEGIHEIKFPNDISGGGLSSGVYFYRLNTGTFTDV
jgi:photosystem II stability/assembly factor-like uncharacterized protein